MPSFYPRQNALVRIFLKNLSIESSLFITAISDSRLMTFKRARRRFFVFNTLCVNALLGQIPLISDIYHNAKLITDNKRKGNERSLP